MEQAANPTINIAQEGSVHVLPENHQVDHCDGGTYKTVPKTKPKVTDFDDSRCAYSAFNWYAIKDGTGYGTSGEPGEVILEGNFIDSFWLQK
ncbi:MAG TPA: hypothetical protein VMA83_12385 [Solirubrobacteraceae bacterium]|nr:hypothetical protein [Solirubrobacteraceae bacterium]